MRADELAVPSGEAVKFDEIGVSAVGTITYIGEWRTKQSAIDANKMVTSFKIVLDDATRPGTKIAIFPEKNTQMARAIGQAVLDTGAVELEVGGKLGVVFASREDVGKPSPMKVFEAQYKRPANVAPTRSVKDLFGDD